MLGVVVVLLVVGWIADVGALGAAIAHTVLAPVVIPLINATLIGARALGRLHRHTRRLPDGGPRHDALVVRREFGPGSDTGSAAAHHAGGLARDLENLDLDPVYGERAMAALMADARSGHVQGPVLFWHTQAPDRVAPPVPADALPREFREFFVAR